MVGQKMKHNGLYKRSSGFLVLTFPLKPEPKFIHFLSVYTYTAIAFILCW